MVGLVLAAGRGSRFAKGGEGGVCKALLEVAGAPLISYSLRALLRLGVKKAVIVIGPQHQSIVQTLGNSFCSMELVYAVQEQPIGLASAMLCAGDQLDDDVVLQLADEVYLSPTPEDQMTDAFRSADFLVGYTLDTAENIRRNFSIATDANDRILHCTEKPTEVTDNRKGTGFCCFSAECFALLKELYDPQTNRPGDLCDFINELVRCGKKGIAFRVAEKEININTPAELEDARQCVK